jgi:nucleotide-binding universal stress UspA family protein
MGYEIGNAILAATDLTPASDEVLRAAGAVAARTGATLHVLHAFDLPPAEGETAPATFGDRIERAEREMERQVARCVPQDVAVGSRKLDIYAAHRAILDRAVDVGASLVVLGPHRRGGMALGVLGTTAERVLHGARVPVLVVRGAMRLPLRAVLAPQDASERAGGALEVGLCWAAALGAHDADPPLPAVEVEILHVVARVPGMADPPFRSAQVEPGENEEVSRAMRGVPCADELDVREEVLWGESPAAEIVRRAGEMRAGLVVLATHGYGAVKRALLGSVASAVVREAPCPVLLVPPALWLGREAEGVESAASATT